MSTDIELDIGRYGERGHYQVRVVRSPAGGDQREEFDLDIDALLRGRSQLEASILSSAIGARRVMSTTERPVLEAGTHLFESVFTRSVYGAYRASLGIAQQQGERLRVVLRLSEPELAALPWEALFDPERQSYVCRQEPMVRRIPAQFNPRAPLEVTPPLEVLAMVASPRGLVALDVDLERANLEEALAELTAAGLVRITWVEPATWRSVHRHLLSGHWHIVHFIGHGDFDDARDEGVLAFVGSDGRADMVEAGRFADLLGEADPTPRLVVLNACSSGQSGADDMLSAIAPALVHSGIEAVAAMQFAVSDDAAIAFAQGFYTAVAHSRGVDEAARSGRIAILGAAGSLEWLTPVLYLRGDTTHPLVVSPRPDPPAAQAPAAQAPAAQAPAAQAPAAQAPAAREAPAQAPAAQEAPAPPATADPRAASARTAPATDPTADRQPAGEPPGAERRDAERGDAEPVDRQPATPPASEDQRDAETAGEDKRVGETRVIPVPPGTGTPRGSGAEPAARRREPPPAKPPGPPRKPAAHSPQGTPPVRQQGGSRLTWALLGVVVVVLLVAGFLVFRPGGGGGGSAGTQTLGNGVALVPERDPTGEFVRLMTFDTAKHGLKPWAAEADRLQGGSTSATDDRFSASPSADRTKVAYLQGAHDGLPVPYVADADGTHAHRLMTSPDSPCANTKRPAWSPDGRRMAVVCMFDDQSWSMWLVDARDGAGVRELVAKESEHELGAPTWDTVGHTVYTWQAPPRPAGSPPGTLGRPVAVADDVDDSRPQEVSGVGDASYTEPDWSSKGLLMVHRAKDHDNKVVVVLEGQRSVVAEGPYLNATWSPDGYSILATRGPDQRHLRLVVLAGDGSAAPDTGVVGNFGAPNWGTR